MDDDYRRFKSRPSPRRLATDIIGSCGDRRLQIDRGTYLRFGSPHRTVRDASGHRMGVSMRELVDRTMGASVSRADLHISRTRDGELLLTSRQDGMIRLLVPDTTAGTSAARR